MKRAKQIARRVKRINKQENDRLQRNAQIVREGRATYFIRHRWGTR